MADLSKLARERATLATVADAIVAAAVGKGLHVAVACSDSQVTFAGQLTRALHARGRACRCLAASPSPSTPTGLCSARHEAGDQTVMVITSGTHALSDAEVCRVSIHVTTETSTTTATSRCDTRDGQAEDHYGPDIVIDYHDPAGPKIRHMLPRLASPAKG